MGWWRRPQAAPCAQAELALSQTGCSPRGPLTTDKRERTGTTLPIGLSKQHQGRDGLSLPLQTAPQPTMQQSTLRPSFFPERRRPSAGGRYLLRGRGAKLVGETGFAPARASAHEFLRLACIRSTTHRKNLVRPGRLARPRAGAAQRFLGPPGLLFHARPPDWSRRPDSHRHGPSRPAGFESAVSTFQPRRDRLVRTEGVAPSRACAHRILAPARLLFRHVRRKTGSGTEICAPLFPIPTGCVAAYALPAIVVEAEGLAPSGAREGGAFTARCNCCSATLRKDWGLERDSHPRPSPYEGAALPAAPSSRNGGPPR